MVKPVVHAYEAAHLFQEYWTEERCQEALPIEVPVLEEKGDLPFKNEDRAQMKGIPNQVQVDTYPYSAGGKIFVSDPDGTNYSASAQFVSAANIILTAAHVVIDSKGNFRRNPVFSRAYERNQGDPFVITRIFVWDEWVKNKNHAYDYAFCLTSKTYDEGLLSLKLGCNYSTFQSMGYPKNYGSGQEMYAVSGTKGNISGQLVQMRGNPFGKGASGGAWMAENKYLIGLNSFRVQGDSDSLWSPLFDEKTEELFEEAIKG